VSERIDQPVAGPRHRRTRWFRRTVPVLAFTVVYFALVVYPPLRILGLSFPQWQPGTPELLAIMVGPLTGRLAAEWVHGRAARVFSAIVMTWLGITFIAWCLLVPWELANLLLDLEPVASGRLLLAATGALALLGLVNAQRLTVRDIRIPALATVAGTRLVQITDVHVGSRTGGFLERVVARVNQLGADHVLITGDLVDFRNVPARELAALGRLTAPAWFVIGNHERYVDLEAICDRLRAHGVRVLRNESADLGSIQLVGIDDAEARTQVGRMLARMAPLPERYRILLYHRPDGAADAAAWGAHLMLCGHTHNGQIVPFNLIVRRVFPRIAGLYDVAGLKLYVSEGTGTWGPVLRLGSRAEIGMIHLVEDRRGSSGNGDG
jgi:uncharacterized protein